jgi:hypothetical protein
MMQLTTALTAWGTPAFEAILKHEIEHKAAIPMAPTAVW